MTKLLASISITILMAIVSSWAGLYTICLFMSCNQTIWWYVGLATALIAISCGSLYLEYYNKTLRMISPKRRALPVLANLSIFESLASGKLLVTHSKISGEVTEEILPNLEDYGWVIKFDRGCDLIITQRDFYYWLLDTVKLQQDLAKIGDKQISPLSQRSHSKLSRKRWDAYIALLESVNAIDYPNANIRQLKSYVVDDPWSMVIKSIKLPLIKL